LTIIQYLRQRPTLLGAVLGLPFAVVMLMVLEHWPTIGWVSVLIWIVLGHFWFNHPLIKTISMASLVGRVLATPRSHSGVGVLPGIRSAELLRSAEQRLAASS
jgi:hypothetical protein